ncbi:MAG: Jag N-terminal domain-containing protein [Deltaproteobacteria bacterium]|nr:Jag N-terminal domain-containing protein [Deltaproteobacteria bacterium]MBW2040549.1 Jag N-terminal domain-containing protein [Deltaproteobacteria bacterium]
MPQLLEFEGKNVDQAVEKACRAVNVPKEKLKYDVISYGSTGIFGLVGSKKARIRVTLARSLKSGEAKAETKDSDVEGDARPETSPESAREAEEKETREQPREPTGDALLAAEGEEALRQIVNSITTDAQIVVKSSPEGLFYHVKGGNSALLIGKRGQTLDAIQYLLEKIVQRKSEQRIRVRVDVEGYQQNRRVSLQRLAEKVSEKVKKTGKPVTLGDLNASDRRIVHLALKNDQEVRTHSKGGGALKKLFIYPRKKPPSDPKS